MHFNLSSDLLAAVKAKYHDISAQRAERRRNRKIAKFYQSELGLAIRSHGRRDGFRTPVAGEEDVLLMNCGWTVPSSRRSSEYSSDCGCCFV
ncbi:hypothetical protein ACHAPT_004174 [Fusarium lateritium]